MAQLGECLENWSKLHILANEAVDNFKVSIGGHSLAGRSVLHQPLDMVASWMCKHCIPALSLWSWPVVFIILCFQLPVIITFHDMPLAKSAIGPAPQAVMKSSEVDQVRFVVGMQPLYCLNMRSSS